MSTVAPDSHVLVPPKEPKSAPPRSRFEPANGGHGLLKLQRQIFTRTAGLIHLHAKCPDRRLLCADRMQQLQTDLFPLR